MNLTLRLNNIKIIKKEIKMEYFLICYIPGGLEPFALIILSTLKIKLANSLPDLIM